MFPICQMTVGMPSMQLGLRNSRRLSTFNKPTLTFSQNGAFFLPRCSPCLNLHESNGIQSLSLINTWHPIFPFFLSRLLLLARFSSCCLLLLAAAVQLPLNH